MRRTKALLGWGWLLVTPWIAQGGSSLVLVPATSNSVIDPMLDANQSWRVEFQIHEWTLPSAGNFNAKIFQLDGVGASAILYPDGVIALGDARDGGIPSQPCFVNTSGFSNVLVRFQRDLAQSRATCELWNHDGTGYNSQTIQLTGVVPYSNANGSLGGGAQTKLGFLRVSRDVIGMGQRPPTTAGSGEWTELRLDGSGSDASGRGHDATLPGVSYSTTPDQSPHAVLRTFDAPNWTPWVSMRAGYPAKLDGGNSFSLADGDETLTYFWQQLGGPTQVQWDNRAAMSPVIRGVVFGTYKFMLRVQDLSGHSSEQTLEVGAVAYDDNGVVIPTDPKVTEIFGPMIAFGKNPWGWADERSLQSHLLQLAGYYESAPPNWSKPGTGTVSYPLHGIGPNGNGGTVLSSAITATDTSITIAQAANLPGLTSLPTWILVGNSTGGGQEVVRVIATTATSGPATLTVAYDGRGVSAGVWSAVQAPAKAFLPSQAWAAGTTVGEFRVWGNSTLFSSDANSALCPGGIPGPMGTPFYSMGTVILEGGSPVISGIGTNWSDNHGAAYSNQVFRTNNTGAADSAYLIRIEATHGGGTPFVWWAQLVSVDSAESTTWSRVLPADVDPGPFSYSLLKNRNPTLTFSDTQGSYRALFDGAGCESETAAFGGAYYGFAAFTGPSNQTSQAYSWSDSTAEQTGVAGAFGPNFYGTGLAQRALYYRSGLKSALEGARKMDDYWAKDPRLCGGWGCAGSPLLIGGGLIGAFSSLVLDPETKLSWSDVRQFIKLGSIGGHDCNAYDTRDSGYLESFLALGALYDPDTTFRNQWRSDLQAVNTRNNICRNQGATGLAAEQDSWANGFLWAPTGVQLHPTVGSTAVTGTNIPPSMCRGVSAGSSFVSRQATRLSSAESFLNTGNAVFLSGKRGGLPFTAQFQTVFVDSSTLELSGVWEGDAGAVLWMQSALDLVGNSDNLMTIASGNSDFANLTKNWECMWNNSGLITLDRPWDGTGGTLYSYRFALAGYGQQPYMLGIKALSLRYGSLLDGTLGTNFGENLTKAAAWIQKYGYDDVTQGMHYGRLFGVCEPVAAPPRGERIFDYRTPNCSRGVETSAVVAARELTQETMPALLAYFSANPTLAARFFVDRAYGSLWCKTSLTASDAYCDAASAGNNPGQSNLTNAFLASSKWPGYFFGMGFAHQWPAARVGGVAAARNRTVSVGFSLGSADHVQVQLTASSGAESEYLCGSVSPCAVTVDDRSGEHWMQIQYLSSSNQVLRKSAPVLLAPEQAVP